MRLVFMGTPESAVPTLARCLTDGHEIVAVWTQPDRPAGRGHKLHASPVKEFALSNNITVHQPAKIKTEEARALFAAHDTDAAVVVAYGRILPTSFLRAPRRGCINVHFSLLPKYRGAAPVNWAIVRGAAETGVTTMLIDEGLDTGALLLQRATPIGDEESAPELLTRLAGLGAALLSETLVRLDEIEARPQRDEEASLAPILRREDGLLAWRAFGAVEIARRVRGLQPWPNAYTTFRGQRLVIWQARRLLANVGTAQAGEIMLAHGDQLVVVCAGGTALQLLEVQPEGRRRLSARDFLNGAHVQVGERLG
jgi:methionyl-tRNA formyltransferase